MRNSVVIFQQIVAPRAQLRGPSGCCSTDGGRRFLALELMTGVRSPIGWLMADRVARGVADRWFHGPGTGPSTAARKVRSTPTSVLRVAAVVAAAPAEFSKVPFTRGVVGMARGPSPNSANSQFFIMFAETPS